MTSRSGSSKRSVPDPRWAGGADSGCTRARLGRSAPRLELAQLPHVPGESWVGLAFGAGARHQSGRLSLVLHRVAAPSTTEPWAGLVIDEWPEVIPSRTETTGLAFHYDDPGAEAPQAVLIAVPPGAAPRWDLATLAEIVRDALDLAKLRGVDGDFLGLLGQILPTIYVSTNVKDDTVSTDFKGLLIADRPLVRSEG